MSPFDPEAAHEALLYGETHIHRRGSLLNLLSLWRAAGRPADRRVGDWLALPETQHLLRPFRLAPHITSATALADLAGLRGIRSIEANLPLLTTRHRRDRRLWAPCPIALAYAGYLDPALQAWLAAVLRDRLDPGDAPEMAVMTLLPYLEQQFAQLQARLDTLDRHAADLLMLLSALQTLMLGNRLAFTARSQAIIRTVVALPPFNGFCPCCRTRPVLAADGTPLPTAQFDHFYHRSLNRPELGWLICQPCHDELGRGGYLLRFSKWPAFRCFQTALLAFRRAQHQAAPPTR